MKPVSNGSLETLKAGPTSLPASKPILNMASICEKVLLISGRKNPEVLHTFSFLFQPYSRYSLFEELTQSFTEKTQITQSRLIFDSPLWPSCLLSVSLAALIFNFIF